MRTSISTYLITTFIPSKKRKKEKKTTFVVVHSIRYFWSKYKKY